MYRNLAYFFDICIAALPALVIPLGLAALSALAVMISGCARHPETVSESAIQGVVTYRERMALPSNAEYTLFLYQLKPGIGRVLLSEIRTPTNGGSVPFPFQIALPEKALSPSETYEMEARIFVNHEILFATPGPVPVVDDAETILLLHRENTASVLPAAPGSLVLSGKKWLLREVGGHKAEIWPDQEVPHLLFMPSTETPENLTSLQGRLAGSDGCNRIIGTYTQSGSNIHFQDLGSTMMLCPRGTEQASAFLKALSEVSTWKLSRTGQSLELLQNNKRLLLFTFTASEKH